MLASTTLALVLNAVMLVQILVYGEGKTATAKTAVAAATTKGKGTKRD